MKKRKRVPPVIADDPAGWWRDPILWAITALAKITQVDDKASMFSDILEIFDELTVVSANVKWD